MTDGRNHAVSSDDRARTTRKRTDEKRRQKNWGQKYDGRADGSVVVIPASFVICVHLWLNRLFASFAFVPFLLITGRVLRGGISFHFSAPDFSALFVRPFSLDNGSSKQDEPQRTPRNAETARISASSAISAVKNGRPRMTDGRNHAVSSDDRARTTRKRPDEKRRQKNWGQKYDGRADGSVVVIPASFVICVHLWLNRLFASFAFVPFLLITGRVLRGGISFHFSAPDFSAFFVRPFSLDNGSSKQDEPQRTARNAETARISASSAISAVKNGRPRMTDGRNHALSSDDRARTTRKRTDEKRRRQKNWGQKYDGRADGSVVVIPASFVICVHLCASLAQSAFRVFAPLRDDFPLTLVPAAQGFDVRDIDLHDPIASLRRSNEGGGCRHAQALERSIHSRLSAAGRVSGPRLPFRPCRDPREPVAAVVGGTLVPPCVSTGQRVCCTGDCECSMFSMARFSHPGRGASD